MVDMMTRSLRGATLLRMVHRRSAATRMTIATTTAGATGKMHRRRGIMMMGPGETATTGTTIATTTGGTLGEFYCTTCAARRPV